MTPIYLVQFRIDAAYVVAEGETKDPGYPTGAEFAGLRIELLEDPRTRKLGPVLDFMKVTSIGSGAGLANTKAASFLRNHCMKVSFAKVGALPRMMDGYRGFTIDRIVPGIVDMKKSDILVESTGVWRAVKKLVLKRDLKTEGFFRLSEWPAEFLCTESVVEDYQKTGLTGLRFGEVSPVRRISVHWYDPIP